MKILFYTVRPNSNASARVHAYQFSNVFRVLGGRIKYNRPFSSSVDMLIKNTNPNMKHKFAYRAFIRYLVYVLIPIRRFYQLADILSHEVIVIQKCMTYWFDYIILEKLAILLARKLQKPLVYHFDDIIDNTKRHKMEYLIRNCDLVITVNEVLVDYASRFSNNVVLIPESIDEREFRKKNLATNNACITIGWIGSAGKDKYDSIRAMIDAIDRLSNEYKLELLIVSNEPLILKRRIGVKIRYVQWTEENDQDFYCDIAINPLNRGSTQKGKGSYKLLKYMAMGIPSITSWTADKFLRNNETCLVANNNEEWYGAMKNLIEDSAMRTRIVNCGYNEARKYCTQAIGKRYYNVLLGLRQKRYER